jgi:hypothetical protein
MEKRRTSAARQNVAEIVRVKYALAFWTAAALRRFRTTGRYSIIGTKSSLTRTSPILNR